ncbi:MAG: hypothetical protein ACO3UW_06860 [Candidatus Nanopelagicales bacterium]
MDQPRQWSRPAYAGWQGGAQERFSAVPGASMVEIDEPTTLPEGFHS